MPSGFSLHIGLNRFDPAHYGNNSGALRGCESDARGMQGIANALGYSSKLLLSEDATRTNVISSIESATSKIKSGDVFLLTYSGHGGRVPDESEDEDDDWDETWCLFDGQFIDDELYRLLLNLAPASRCIVVSDSCHSGTMTKAVYEFLAAKFVKGTAEDRVKSLSPSQAAEVYQRNKELYDKLRKQIGAVKDSDLKAQLNASVILLSGCQDNEFSYDGPVNSAFTARLLAVWDNGKFAGTYRMFHQAIAAGLTRQNPNLSPLGAGVQAQLEKKPFKI